MKRIILTLTMLVALVATASAQAEIKFDKLIHNFGSFEESNPVQKATFTFTNVGNKPLIINQAIASCGCTVPSYTKKPIAPGEKGQISVTYNGKGMFPGHFKKIFVGVILAQDISLCCTPQNTRSLERSR